MSLVQLLKSMTGGGGGGNGSSNGSASNTSVDPNASFEDRVQAFGTERWKDLKSAYIVYHQIVWDALLKYSGVLWVQWNNSSKMFDIVASDDDWVPTPEVNRFSPAIDSMMSNFSAVPEIEAVPANVDDMDAFAISDIATRLAQWVQKTNALNSDFKGDEDKPGRAGSLLTLAGSVFTLCYPQSKQVGERPVTQVVPAVGARCAGCDTYNSYSPDQAPTASPDGTPALCPQCANPLELTQTETAQPTGEMEPVMAHSVRIEIGNPLYMLPRPGAKSMADLGYHFWAERMHLDRIWELFQVEAEADQEYLDGYSTSYENTLQYYYTGAASSTVRTKEECMVVQLFIEPGKIRAIPEGAWAIMVNGNWTVRPWEGNFYTHPTTKCNYKNQPMLFFGRTDAFDLAKLQKESNHYEGMIKLHGMTSSMDPILLDENTQVDEITNRGDRVIKYRSLGPGSKEPSRLQHGTLDNGIYMQRDKIASEFQNVSGAVNVWRGEAPGSITAASAISQLRGQAEQMFATPEGNWNAFWTETMRKAVTTLQQTMEPWEIAAIAGKGKDVEIAMFKQADLEKTLNFVSTSHGLPKTRDERRQEMLTLWDRGALDMSDVNVKERMVELFGETGMMQQFNKDATRARLENEQIRTGKLENPQPMVGIEDLNAHYNIHVEAIKSLDFDKWDPQLKQILIHHALDTKEAMMMEQEGMIDPMGNPTPAGAAASAQAGGQPSAGSAGSPNAGGRSKNGGGRVGHNRKAPSRSIVGASNNSGPNIPTGPNGPGAGSIPGGNR
jgi:hypothetical protein